MTKYLDLQKWKRKEHFDFFKSFDNPFFNICTNINITNTQKYIKTAQYSFSHVMLYLSLKAANYVEEFRYRIRDNQVIIHEIIHGGNTIANKNETFSFCYFNYNPTFLECSNNIVNGITKAQEQKMRLQCASKRDNLIHFSTIPWISFTGLSHARKYNTNDSTPKITFGKYFTENSVTKLPISVEVHHSLVDAFHLSKFLDFFQNYANAPEQYIT